MSKKNDMMDFGMFGKWGWETVKESLVMRGKGAGCSFEEFDEEEFDPETHLWEINDISPLRREINEKEFRGKPELSNIIESKNIFRMEYLAPIDSEWSISKIEGYLDRLIDYHFNMREVEKEKKRMKDKINKRLKDET